MYKSNQWTTAKLKPTIFRSDVVKINGVAIGVSAAIGVQNIANQHVAPIAERVFLVVNGAVYTKEISINR